MNQLEDIYDIIESQNSSNFKMLLLACVIIFLLILFLLYKKYFIRKKLDPKQIALQELKSLNINNYFQNSIDKFYEKLSGILKKYFENLTQENCTAFTDHEFVNYIENKDFKLHNLSFDLKVKTIEIINSFEKIKFANEQVSKELMKKDLEDIELIINSVKKID